MGGRGGQRQPARSGWRWRQRHGAGVPTFCGRSRERLLRGGSGGTWSGRGWRRRGGGSRSLFAHLPLAGVQQRTGARVVARGEALEETVAALQAGGGLAGRDRPHLVRVTDGRGQGCPCCWAGRDGGLAGTYGERGSRPLTYVRGGRFLTDAFSLWRGIVAECCRAALWRCTCGRSPRSRPERNGYVPPYLEAADHRLTRLGSATTTFKSMAMATAFDVYSRRGTRSPRHRWPAARHHCERLIRSPTYGHGRGRAGAGRTGAVKARAVQRAVSLGLRRTRRPHVTCTMYAGGCSAVVDARGLQNREDAGSNPVTCPPRVVDALVAEFGSNRAVAQHCERLTDGSPSASSSLAWLRGSGSCAEEDHPA